MKLYKFNLREILSHLTEKLNTGSNIFSGFKEIKYEFIPNDIFPKLS